MKHFLAVTLAAVVLMGCGPVLVVERSGPRPNPYISRQLELPTYPGSRILELSNRNDGSSRVRFTTDIDPLRVYNHFNNEIIARGYSRTFVQFGSGVFQSYYEGGASGMLELKLQFSNSRYTLDLRP
jgi:hypothetical protein